MPPGKSLRRFRSGEFRFLSTHPTGMTNRQLLQRLTAEPARDEKHVTWASCRAKNGDDMVRPQYSTKTGFTFTVTTPDLFSAISIKDATISTKLRGTRNVSQLVVTTHVDYAIHATVFDSPKFKPRYPSCIDDQLKLK